MSGRVGFVGLGIMGSPMAANLVREGLDVIVTSRSMDKAGELVAAGATAVDTPAAVAEQADVVITMLPDSPDVRDVLTGPAGLLTAARPGQLLVDMSTISPVVTRELAETVGRTGVAYVDAPVSGGEMAAQDGTLSIMVGGDAGDVRRARPFLEVLGSTITHVGPVGAGQVAKACNQVAVALTIGAVSEALTLAAGAAVEPGRVLDALRGGLAGSQVIERKGDKLLAHDFEPGFRVELHHKDLGIALETARSSGVTLPLTAAADQMLAALRTRGYGTADHTALLALVEELSGLPVERS